MIPGGAQEGLAEGLPEADKAQSWIERPWYMVSVVTVATAVISSPAAAAVGSSSGPLNNFVSRISRRAGKVIVPAARGYDSHSVVVSDIQAL
jgi:hypothetical protein